MFNFQLKSSNAISFLTIWIQDYAFKFFWEFAILADIHIVLFMKKINKDIGISKIDHENFALQQSHSLFCNHLSIHLDAGMQYCTHYPLEYVSLDMFIRQTFNNTSTLSCVIRIFASLILTATDLMLTHVNILFWSILDRLNELSVASICL